MLSGVLAQPVFADSHREWRDWPLGERVVVAVGLYSPRLDTQVRVSDSQGNVGTALSFEQTLGLADNKTTPIGYIDWRFFKRHSLTLNYFDLNRSGNNSAGVIIKVGDQVINASLPVQSFFDIRSIDLMYSYSLLFREKFELALGLGIAMQELEFGLQGTDACQLPDCGSVSERVDADAPIPTLDLRFRYAFTDKWIFDSRLGWLGAEFELDDSQDLSGNIWNIAATLRWKAWEHFGFNAGYKYFNVDIDSQKRDLLAEIDYRYNGIVLGVEAFF